MKIGIAYDLKAVGQIRPDLPDELQEEYDSPATIEAIAGALRRLGNQVIYLADGREFLDKILTQPPDFVFNIAEGQGVGRSREARVPAALEMLGVPYTGSDPLTLAVTLDKDCAKRLVVSAGVAVPAGFLLADTQLPSALTDLQFPVIVKPAWEGSSKGIRSKSLVDHPQQLGHVVESLRHDHQQPILAEEYIEGDELTVGVVGNAPPRPIGTMRVLPRQSGERFIYSLEVKRDWENRVRYEVPARLSAADNLAVTHAALAAYRVLGCRDVARLDFRLRDGVPYFLEANPLPGLNPDYSDLVILARLSGWTYDRLIETILQAAIDRQPAVKVAASVIP